MEEQVCLNPNCASYGKVHPNCKCYADGGQVHYCSQGFPHHTACEYMASGGEAELHHQIHLNPDHAIEHAAANHGLHHLMTKTGHTKSEEPHRAAMDLIDHAKRGHAKSHSHVHGMFDKKGPDHETHGVEALKAHVEDLAANPDKILDVGGNLSNSLPDHSGMLAAKTANAVQYLHSLKPLGTQAGPFDKIQPPSKMEQNHYDRQLKIAQHPLSILEHVKNGTVSPADLTTLKTLYPNLNKTIMDKTFEKVAAARERGEVLPYKQKIGLSQLIGPLDYTQTPAAMQAIIKSAAGNTQVQSQGQQKGSGSKATSVELKQINKVNELYETPLQKLQTDNK